MNELNKFITALKSGNLNEAAKFTEGAAKELCNVSGVTPTSLSRLSEILKQEIKNNIDLVYVKSEIQKLGIPYISEVIAHAIEKYFNDLPKLRRLIDALVNFYKYYKE